MRKAPKPGDEITAKKPAPSPPLDPAERPPPAEREPAGRRSFSYFIVLLVWLSAFSFLFAVLIYEVIDWLIDLVRRAWGGG
jgi:hypothetical protein